MMQVLELKKCVVIYSTQEGRVGLGWLPGLDAHVT